MSRAVWTAWILFCCFVAVSNTSHGDEPQWGTLTGRIVFDGPAPPPERIRIRSEPERDSAGRALLPADPFYHDKQLFDESLVVGDDGGLANVFVYLAARDAIPVHPDLAKSPAEPAVLQVRGGRFDPHVLAVRSDRPLVIRNDDPVLVNVRGVRPRASEPFNLLLSPEQRREFSPTLKQELIPMRVYSDLRTQWMSALVLPRDTPYFAVTDRSGRFRIENLPAGRWEFVLWHERAGYLKTEQSPRGRLTVSIGAGTNDLGTIRVGPELFDKRTQ